ncbi:hypothetical protein OQA88_337 [Cercophora sp. LCS_1]
MPESYPGEHVMRAEIMANSTEPELSRESIMLSIFSASNNLGDLDDDDTWNRTVAGIRQIGAMDGKLDLRSFANNITISAFMEKLFHAAFRRVIERDPWSNDDMMEDLSEEEWEDMSVRTGNPDLVRTLIEHGADLRTIRSPCDPLYLRLTPLGEAAASAMKRSMSLQLVKYLTQTLCLRFPSVPITKLLADDAVVAAAAGNDEAIRHFNGLSQNVIHTPNGNGVTPLQAAARHGKKSTCELLLQLGARVKYTPLEKPSPLHLASFGGHEDIIDLLVSHGAEVDSKYKTPNVYTTSQHLMCRTYDIRSLAIDIATPLDLALQQMKLFSALKLIQLGAQLTGHEVSVAAKHTNKELLCAALARGGNPNQADDSGKTPLQLVLSQLEGKPISPRMEMVTALLSAGALLKGGELVSAMRLGIEFVGQLLSYGAASTTTTAHASEIGILEAAVLSGDSAIMAMVDEWHPGLYEAGALCAAIATVREPEYIGALLRRRPSQTPPQPLEATAVAMAVTAKSSHLLQLLLRYLPPSNQGVLPSKYWGPGGDFRLSQPFWRGSVLEGSPLASAVWNQDEHAIRQLLDHGFRPDWNTFYVLAETGNTELARLLTNYALLSSETVRRVGNWGYCPLSAAVSHGDVEFLRLLMTVGLKIDDNASRRTAFQNAVECAKLDMMQILLEAGANINAPAYRSLGATALQIAATKGHLGIAKQLLDLGADPNARRASYYGRTALEGAAEHGRIDMIELLLQHGAKTTGNGRRQYVRSVFLASREGHSVAADYLQRCREWTEEDRSMMEDIEESSFPDESDDDDEFENGIWSDEDSESDRDHDQDEEEEEEEEEEEVEKMGRY